MIKIPFREDRREWDCCQRYYRRAIWNTLLELRPKYSLEIGSYLFQSSSVWSKFYEEQLPGGHLITCDIAKWSNSPPPPNVTQVMVYPHIDNIADNHGGINLYLNNPLAWVGYTLYKNRQLIDISMQQQSIEYFDLVFVDGDHSKTSFRTDLRIAQGLTWFDGYILIDDINDMNNPEQVAYYQELKTKGNEFYEFDDWEINPGMALIQNKELTL